ncbi:DUF3168 domain-containing protein [Paracoccaceae bacterium GXU_MW_L88]
MTIRLTGAVQRALYGALRASPEIVAEVGTGIFDAAPDGTIDGRVGTYILIGETKIRPRGSQGAGAARHELAIEVISDARGFADVKHVAEQICALLEGADLPLEGGAIRDLRSIAAEAKRDSAPERRRMTLTFRAFVEEE